jgi:hypothetical protein
MATGILDTFAIFTVLVIWAIYAKARMFRDIDALFIFANLAIGALFSFAGIFHAFAIDAGGALITDDISAGFDAFAIATVFAASANNTGAGIGDAFAIFAALVAGAADFSAIVICGFGDTRAFDTDLIFATVYMIAEANTFAIAADLVVAALYSAAIGFDAYTINALETSGTFLSAESMADAIDAARTVGGGLDVVDNAVAIVIAPITGFGLR